MEEEAISFMKRRRESRLNHLPPTCDAASLPAIRVIMDSPSDVAVTLGSFEHLGDTILEHLADFQQVQKWIL